MDTLSQARELFLRSDIVVIDHNPECADMDNPRGEVYGYAVTVVAEAPDGSRWQHDHAFVNRWEDRAVDPARRLLDRMVESLKSNNFQFNPAHWHRTDSRYGSEAYLEDCAGMTPKQLADY